ncbi:MAG: hypothetical protein H7Z13_18770 [Ferruginibacter sp.]|nr:hypothetical protein [Ferruginibacter sp.]
MQQELFEPVTQRKTQSLVISSGGKQVLTKNQQAFNKLTQKIEKLHKDIERRQFQFDTALQIYGNDVFPVKSRLAGYRRQLVTILWDIYKSKKLSKTDQRHLKTILKDQVQELCSQMEGGPDEALKKMFAELEGISFERIMQREKEMMKSELEEMFDEMEMDIDFDGVDLHDEKAMAEKMAEVRQKLTEKEEEDEEQFKRDRLKKKKTAKQQENERIRQAVDEMKQKNISTIYKQLAKLFHPDLERDEERKLEKDVLMKELTAAYEAKNLHALLTLELKWIHKENDHLESLSEEKLSIYLQILREQANDMEHEMYAIFQQPRYQVLVQEFGLGVQRAPLETVKAHLRDLQNMDIAFKSDLENFQSPHALRHIKRLINEWKNMQWQNTKLETEFLRSGF